MRHKACIHPRQDSRITLQGPGILSVLAWAAALPFTALPSHAGTFTPPQGCKLEVTVQNRGCTVSQIYRCGTDPDGHQRSAIFNEDGPTHISRIDSETRWIESRNPNSGIEDRLVDEARDHASFSTLIETGHDDFDFWTESNTGERLHHVGHDELTGETVTVDGIKLEKTRFELTTTDVNGEVLIERSGQQFINRAMGRFFGGQETQSDWTGLRQETNDSPVLFNFPGEKGFGETTPQFDCGQIVAQLPDERAQL
ncbi:hypothetical protein [Paracoccus methylarcula]|uniref:Uncharacterized protein n=1 Tax=Paracoccus methylarcula TaxID=72022 RepID=A0A422QV25_9RHOB|nr:hypothetical protein [Paracoccus methylarcula]RNF33702.1 hypothetical protein A7A09_014520 [Paracoccus methylarcula]